jgi:hypothetical protein
MVSLRIYIFSYSRQETDVFLKNNNYLEIKTNKIENPNSSSFLRNQLVLKSRGWELNPHIAALQAAA